MFSRGEIYYHSGKVINISFDNDNTLANATVEGNYKNYSIILKFNPLGELKEYKCNCQSSIIWRGACKHVVAALLSVLDIKSELSGRPESRFSRKLIDNLEKQIYKEIDESIINSGDSILNNQKPRIETKLFLSDSNKPFLNFYVGNSRMYVIKNINEFIVNIKKQAVAAYGSKFQFRHTAGAFDSGSQGLLEFITNENAVYHEISKSIMNNYNYLYMIKENARNLLLNERNTDDFFSLFIERTLNTDIGAMKVIDELPPIRYVVELLPEEVLLKGEHISFIELNGRKYKYIIINDTIYRTDKNRGAILTAISCALNTSYTGYISLRNSERIKFISVILPYLKREQMISNIHGKPDNTAIFPMSPKLYFDAEGKEVLCRAVFSYGNDEINPVKHQDIITIRDLPYEYRIISYLRMYGFETDEELGVYRLNGSESIYRLLHNGLEELKNHVQIYVTDELVRQKPKPVQSKVGITLSGNLLEISLDESEFSFFDIIDALDSLRLKKKYHRLKDGRFINLEDQNAQTITQIINSLDLSKEDVSDYKTTLPKYRSIYIDKLTEGSDLFNRSADFQMLSDKFKLIGDIRQPQPEAFKGTLREYQKIGLNWLVSLSSLGFGGVLADDMGLGKTIQIIAFLLSVQATGKQSLVVAPTSLIFNWENEILRFAPVLNARVITGTPEKRKELLDIPADIYITTYDMLKRDLDLYIDMQFETLIADEAQYIKNPQTQNARAIKAIRAKNRFALTGTPIENSLTELWSIFDFIMPGYLYSSHKFTKLYETPIIKYNDKERSELLRKQISPFLLRRMKKDVLTELPEKTETNLSAELLPDQKRLYMAHLLKARGELNFSGGISQNRMKVLAELTKLRQICCHPALFIEGYAGGSGKLTLALETIQMTVESGHRPLIFSQFTSMLSILMNELNEAGMSYFYLDGASSSADRIDMANRFNRGEGDLFLISLRAGGTGLNLTGADVVIHYDPWWNPAVMDQASDRAHRFGQTQMVQVFNLVTRGTIEQKIMDLHDKKKNLVDSVISEGGQFLSLMSEAEIMELFSV